MKKLICLFTFALLATAQDIQFNFDQSADFTKFKTYKWLDMQAGGAQIDDLSRRQISDAIEAQLAKEGLVKAQGDAADLAIAYQVALNQEREITSYNSGWGYGPGWRYGYGGGTGITTATTSTLHIGSLAVDMYDMTKKQMVWRGIASKTLDTNAKPEKRQKNLTKALDKLFKKYPPQAKS